MKKVFAILGAILLLTSGMKVSIDHHYCGGTLADVKISLSGKLASCGMEEEKIPSCPDHQTVSSKCCDDQVTFYSFDSKYFGEQFRMDVPSWGKTIFTHSVNLLTVIPEITGEKPATVFPPGDLILKNITQSKICVFRI